MGPFIWHWTNSERGRADGAVWPYVYLLISNRGVHVKITLKELKKQAGLIEQWIVESVDLSLYIAHARINGEERVIAENEKKILKRHNLLEMKRVLKAVAGCEIILRQRSAYDEMVGHSHPAAANTLEISLGDAPLPEWLN